MDNLNLPSVLSGGVPSPAAALQPIAPLPVGVLAATGFGDVLNSLATAPRPAAEGNSIIEFSPAAIPARSPKPDALFSPIGFGELWQSFDRHQRPATPAESTEPALAPPNEPQQSGETLPVPVVPLLWTAPPAPLTFAFSLPAPEAAVHAEAATDPSKTIEQDGRSPQAPSLTTALSELSFAGTIVATFAPPVKEEPVPETKPAHSAASGPETPAPALAPEPAAPDDPAEPVSNAKPAAVKSPDQAPASRVEPPTAAGPTEPREQDPAPRLQPEAAGNHEPAPAITSTANPTPALAGREGAASVPMPTASSAAALPPGNLNRTLQVRLGLDDSAIALRVTERGSHLHVAVNATSPEVAAVLRDGLPELVGALQSNGFDADFGRSATSPNAPAPLRETGQQTFTDDPSKRRQRHDLAERRRRRNRDEQPPPPIVDRTG